MKSGRAFRCIGSARKRARKSREHTGEKGFSCGCREKIVEKSENTLGLYLFYYPGHPSGGRHLPVGTNSYGFQLQAGKRLDGKEDYRNALTHYLRAVELDDEAVEAKVGAGLDYYQLGEYDEAWDILIEAVEADPANVEAFRCLLAICCEQDDYDEIERLQRMAEGHDAQQLFDEYLVAGPGFSFDEGTYDDDLQLELTSGNGNTVYYTLDGTDPIRRGQLYREPILLTDGETTVKAAAKNSDGIYSRVVEKTYRISYKKPEYPTVSPMQENFMSPPM